MLVEILICNGCSDNNNNNNNNNFNYKKRNNHGNSNNINFNTNINTILRKLSIIVMVVGKVILMVFCFELQPIKGQSLTTDCYPHFHLAAER